MKKKRENKFLPYLNFTVLCHQNFSTFAPRFILYLKLYNLITFSLRFSILIQNITSASSAFLGLIFLVSTAVRITFPK